METSTHTGLGGTLDTKLKLSTYEWDDTKSGAQSFWQFMMSFSALVRMTLYGDIFEDLLDVKCRRTTIENASPQWMLGDPDLVVRPGGRNRTDQSGEDAKSPAKSTNSNTGDPQEDDDRTHSEQVEVVAGKREACTKCIKGL